MLFLMEDTTTAVAPVKAKYLDPVGRSLYGPEFPGFHKLADIKDLIPAFKEYYYQEKIKNDKTTLTFILNSFNTETCKPLARTFYPSLNQVRLWRKKWDLDLMQQKQGKELILMDDVEKKNIKQVLKTRGDDRELILGGTTDGELEMGMRTLGGELMNDAMQMLRDDQELEEVYEPEILVKRRSYVLNVFSHVSKLVISKAALMLKASEEKRNNAGFMMSLIAKAQSGKMSDEEMALLRTAYVPKKDVEQQAV